MTGPAYDVVPDARYAARLLTDKIHPWYCGIPGAQPRAYSFQDGAGGPSPGDRVVTTVSTHLAALRALAAVDAGRKPSAEARSCLRVVLHEYCHCMVRLRPDGSDDRLDAGAYSHPDTAWPAILHAVRHWFPLNAFSGLLRWRDVPGDAYTQGLAWLRAQGATA